MKPSARYQSVIELLHAFMVDERPADACARYFFKNRRYIGSSDRRFVYTRFYAVIRHHHRLKWHHEQLTYMPTARTYVMAHAILTGEQTLSSLQNKICTDEEYGVSEMTTKEQTLLAQLKGVKYEPEKMPERIALECPEWAWGLMVESYGREKAAEIMRAMNEPNTLHLRVNTLLGERERVIQTLTNQNYDVRPGEYSPWCIRMADRPQMSQHKLLQKGIIEIQNEGSQLIAMACDVKPGMRVVDFCAGAGGKTLALAAKMQNKGMIVACDVLEKRLRRSKERFRRAGVHNIETRPLSSERDKWVKKHKGKYDLVLVDAPCSGLGTWRGDPDKRWRSLGPGLKTLVPLQREILDSASRLVKPGGQLVYATCSLLPQENETQVETFLKAHPDFSIADLPQDVPQDTRSEGFMKANPADHNTDGFFAAVLQRAPAEKSE